MKTAPEIKVRYSKHNILSWPTRKTEQHTHTHKTTLQRKPVRIHASLGLATRCKAIRKEKIFSNDIPNHKLTIGFGADIHITSLSGKR